MKAGNCMKYKVMLTAFDQRGNKVEDVSTTVEDFYGENCPVIDSNEYRAERLVREVRGVVYDADGNLGQEFVNSYASGGEIVSSRTVHADGQVGEHRYKSI